MDFNFLPEQEQLRDMVRRYMDKAYSFEQRCTIVSAGGFDRGAYQALAELGLTGLNIAETHGGSEMGSVAAMIVLEELGRAICIEPLIQSLLCAELLQRFANDATKELILPKIANGQTIVIFAAQERKSRYNMQQCETVAEVVGSGYALTGTKDLVVAGDAADAYIVPAMLKSELSLFLVERQGSGIFTHGYGLQDGSRAADIKFNNASAQLLTANGKQALSYAQDIGVAYTCAYAVGVMEKTLEITTAYLNTRKQFNQFLANFQVLRHRIVEMKMQLELARSMSYFATMKLDSPLAERSRASAQAKCQLSQSMRFIGQQAVQVHGGIGLTDEYILGHYFKTLTQLEMNFGDGLFHLGRVTQLLEEGAGVIT